ncbi:MAG: hypothetical protein HKN47_29090, partial [Pirellulaceae bacterium]|nr:hypothetical protein [Pirellulaceae bacterium]
MSQLAKFIVLATAWATPLAANEISFNRDIRPLLSETCFVCHGPDVAEVQGGLRLDLRESAVGESDSGAHAIVPGDVDASHLVARLESKVPYERMPPPESGKTLKKDQIQLLKDWIAHG